jgi:hypothetical protein
MTIGDSFRGSSQSQGTSVACSDATTIAIQFAANLIIAKFDAFRKFIASIVAFVIALKHLPGKLELPTGISRGSPANLIAQIRARFSAPSS